MYICLCWSAHMDVNVFQQFQFIEFYSKWFQNVSTKTIMFRPCSDSKLYLYVFQQFQQFQIVNRLNVRFYYILTLVKCIFQIILIFTYFNPNISLYFNIWKWISCLIKNFQLINFISMMIKFDHISTWFQPLFQHV